MMRARLWHRPSKAARRGVTRDQPHRQSLPDLAGLKKYHCVDEQLRNLIPLRRQVTTSMRDLLANLLRTVVNQSYPPGIDGRGSTSVTAGTLTTRCQFVLIPSDRAQLMESDGVKAASGAVLRQDPTAIANVTGPFVFSMLGDKPGPPFGVIALLSSDVVDPLCSPTSA
jgi:hypothetical protein